MDNRYLEEAKRWYETLFIAPSGHRFFYFSLVALFVFLIIMLYGIYQETFPLKIKLDIVAKLHHNKTERVLIYKTHYKNKSLGVAEFIIAKAITQMEGLDFENQASAIEDKIKLLKSFFASDIIQEYQDNLALESESDMIFIIQNIRKTVKIKKIIFINANNEPLIENIWFKLGIVDDSERADVYFDVCNELTNECYSAKVRIKFEISFPVNRSNLSVKKLNLEDRIVRFNILSYEKENI
jgi:hypothetical protein